MRTHVVGTIAAIVIFVSLSASQPTERHGIFSGLLSDFVSNGLVDYQGFKNDSRLERYLDQLASINPDSLHDASERLAFWINAYNAYTIKLVVEKMPINSIRDVSLGLPVMFGPWSIEIAEVGGRLYTLNEIEHDIIRREFRDPRVHFALVCASLSCPKLRTDAYEGSRLQAQLEEDATRFVNDSTRNRFDHSARTVFLSRIFDWYESDFERETMTVAAFIGRYVGQEKGDLLENKETTFEFLPYDWSLNGK